MAIGERKAGPQVDVATLATQPKKQCFSGVCYRNGIMGSQAWANAYAGAKAWPSDVQGSKPNLSAGCAKPKVSRALQLSPTTSSRSQRAAKMSTRTSGAYVLTTTTRSLATSLGTESA